ncbi:uncharacterized protein OCT59_002298 [Rhizophagus irregularis]|uniref:uncharacterized protein n=1 Tax=Rhizophagus irregularis TaxID=588596 RepID=UPI001A0A1A77|nr:hypothetical protein OCT59_002298 [Rhizophagus irregularis]GBC47045.2 kinase-like domain-containing protein [Rhizophagus irregularis DAOM 181602=DAOM 197198]
MLMWEVSSGQPPFNNYEHDYELAMNTVNEPRNATEDEQEAFHSNKSYDDFHIPNNVDDFNKFSSKKNSTSKISSLFKAGSKKLSNIFKRSSKNDTQNDYKIETMQQQTMNHQIKDNDEDDTFNNPNLHSEEQDELELPN